VGAGPVTDSERIVVAPGDQIDTRIKALMSCAGGDERSPPPRFDYPMVLTTPVIHRPQPRLSSFTTGLSISTPAAA
jgi:hypothetical protein